MIRDLVLDAQAAEPAVRQVDLNLPAQQPLRADGEHVADDEHPDHQHRINRRAAKRRVVGCKLSTHPGQIEHGRDLAHKVIAWYHLVVPKLVEKLLLLVLQPPHHRSPPQRIVSERRNHRSQKPSTAFCNKIGTSRTSRDVRLESANGRFCCKSLFALAIKISFGCTGDFHVNMWGTSSSEEKLAGDPGNVIEATSIGGRWSEFFTAGKLAPGNFGLLQQYRHL